jgi:nucleotide-binding universal stress UspA family protein
MNALTSHASVTRARPFIRKIVAAVDLTSRSLTTAQFAASVAQSFGASLILAYVHPPENMYNFVNHGGYDLVDPEQGHQRHALVSLTEAVARSYPFCSHAFLVGDPADEVVSFARDMGADLIIAASHHPTFLASLLHLDQAPKVIHRAHCPVLVFHGPEEGARS